jgi:hypothetical protein
MIYFQEFIKINIVIIYKHYFNYKNLNLIINHIVV